MNGKWRAFAANLAKEWENYTIRYSDFDLDTSQEADDAYRGILEKIKSGGDGVPSIDDIAGSYPMTAAAGIVVRMAPDSVRGFLKTRGIIPKQKKLSGLAGMLVVGYVLGHPDAPISQDAYLKSEFSTTKVKLDSLTDQKPSIDVILDTVGEQITPLSRTQEISAVE